MKLELPRARLRHRADYLGLRVLQVRPSKELAEAAAEFIAVDSVDTRVLGDGKRTTRYQELRAFS
jgi:hypothetical protein